jgi:hypothetical protein
MAAAAESISMLAVRLKEKKNIDTIQSWFSPLRKLNFASMNLP